MGAEEWKSGDFSRRRYTVQGDALDKARSIRVLVQVDGETLVNVSAPEPGLLAFVSRPSDDGFDIEIVERTKVPRVTDIRLPNGETTENVASWQLEALGVHK